MKKLISLALMLIIVQLVALGSIALAAPNSEPVPFTLYSPVSSGASTIIVSDNGAIKLSDHFKDGDTILIDKDGANPEFREIVSMNYNSTTKRTQLTLATSLKYAHSASVIVISANKSALTVNLSLNANTSVGEYSLTLLGDYSKLRVGDTLSINPSNETMEYEFYNDPDLRTIYITNGDTSKLKVGDSFIINEGTSTEEIGIIEYIDNLPRIGLKKDLNNFYDEFSTHYGVVPKIEKVQIRSINYSDGSVSITSPLRYSHTSNEPVVITNTASSLYEHDSAYANNQNQGNQVTKTYNEGQANEVVVPATNGPHGKYTSNTNACGRCHQLHAAQAPKLIRFPIASAVSATNPIYATCTFCHTYNGQSTYDVKNGQIWDTADGKRYATNGGGFERMLVVEGEPANATFAKVTSKHRVNEQWINGQYVKFNAPGGYMSSTGHIELTCTSCHQPHGTKNGRQLHEKITVRTGPGQYDFETRDTTTGAGFNNNAVIINVDNPFADETTKYSKEIIKFCTACHSDYYSQSGSSPINGKYRHKMGMTPDDGMNKGDQANNFGFGSVNDKRKLILPLGTEGENGRDQSNGVPGVVVCTTCHYAHGTFTSTEGVKQYDDIKLNGTTNLNTVGGWETSKNLRLDNRGVCQNCHNRTKDETLPKLVNVLNPSTDGSGLYGSESTLSSSKMASYTDDTIMLRFNQYMWTNRMWGLNDSINGADPLLFDIENPNNFVITGTVSGATKPLSAKLQPDGRTVILQFKKGDIPAGRSFNLTVTDVADLNWNKLTSETVTLTK